MVSPGTTLLSYPASMFHTFPSIRSYHSKPRWEWKCAGTFKTWPLVRVWPLRPRAIVWGLQRERQTAIGLWQHQSQEGTGLGDRGSPVTQVRDSGHPPHPDRAVTEALGDNIREGAGEGPCPDRCRPIVSK